jgi:hypothetical protein
VSRLTLTILAAAGITLFSGVLFYWGTVSRPEAVTAVADAPTTNPHTTTYYRNVDHSFSFRYPADATITSFSDGNTEVFTLTLPGETLELQITPSDSPRLTEADIREGVGADVIHGLTTSLLALGIPLLRADVLLPDLGPIPHAWFLRRGYQYQVMANRQGRDLLDTFLAGFCFQDVPLPADQPCAGKPTP